MLYRNSVRGFTLIEMIVVVVLLAVLAVVAAPRFFNLQNDARSAVLHGLKASMATAAAQVYGKSVVQSVDKDGESGEGSGSSITVGGDTIKTVYGYPIAQFKNVWERLLQGSFGEVPYEDPAEYEWMWHNPQPGDGLYFMPRHYSNKSQGCYVKYVAPIDADHDYTLEMVTDGC